MKRILVLLLIGFIVFTLAAKDSMAAKKTRNKGPAGISQEEMTAMSDSIDTYTKKVYSASLFSPAENAQMIEIKIKLDNQMMIAPDAGLAPLYYKAGNLYRSREYKNEAVQCYQTILENFADTAFGPKAKQALMEMGVKIFDPNAIPEPTTSEAAPDAESQGLVASGTQKTTDSKDPKAADSKDAAKTDPKAADTKATDSKEPAKDAAKEPAKPAEEPKK